MGYFKSLKKSSGFVNKKAKKNHQFCGRRLFDLFKILRTTIIDENQVI